MFNRLKSWLNQKERLRLAKDIIATADVEVGLTEENRQKLVAFLVLTENFGFSDDSRVGNELSGIIGHVDSRPIAVTRHLIIEILKGSDTNA